MTSPRDLLLAALLAALLVTACSRGDSAEESSAGSTASGQAIRVTGSDTMVNLVQAWAENYRKRRPDVSIQVAGGGSGVGIAGLIDGILDIAAASREMEPDEIARATQHNGSAPKEFTVGLDGLAVYVHAANPIAAISIEDLAEVYGDGGQVVKWSQLGVANAACDSDEIIRVSRQNNSGTYVYFREAVLGKAREFTLGSIDQSGSKDVVALVSRTPCAIGYSGMAYAVPGVRMLGIAARKGLPPVGPTLESAVDGSYPIARPLYLYTREDPEGEVKQFLDWVLSPEGQDIVAEVGYVPVPKAGK